MCCLPRCTRLQRGQQRMPCFANCGWQSDGGTDRPFPDSSDIPHWCTLSVTKSIPSYLRIHSVPSRSSTSPSASTGEDVESFWDAYREATGWRRDRRASAREFPLRLLPAVTVDSMAGSDTDAAPAVSHQHAVRLAESAAQMTDQLQQAREMIRRQEAELAARASILVGDEDRDRIADRIETTLADAALACGCDAAVMYLLDDDTQYRSRPIAPR